MNEEQEKRTKDLMDSVLIQVCEGAQIDRFYLFSLIMEMMEEEGYLMPEEIDCRTIH